MTLEEILKKVKEEKLTFEQAFQELSNIGYCPNLLNNDNSKWAVVFDGMQNIPDDEDEDLFTSFLVESNKWHSDIKHALIIALSK